MDAREMYKLSLKNKTVDLKSIEKLKKEILEAAKKGKFHSLIESLSQLPRLKRQGL